MNNINDISKFRNELFNNLTKVYFGSDWDVFELRSVEYNRCDTNIGRPISLEYVVRITDFTHTFFVSVEYDCVEFWEDDKENKLFRYLNSVYYDDVPNKSVCCMQVTCEIVKLINSIHR